MDTLTPAMVDAIARIEAKPTIYSDGWVTVREIGTHRRTIYSLVHANVIKALVSRGVLEFRVVERGQGYGPKGGSLRTRKEEVRFKR